MQSRNLDNTLEILDDLRRDAEKMKKIYRALGSQVACWLYNSLINFVQNEFPRRFETAAADGAFDVLGDWQRMKSLLSLRFLFPELFPYRGKLDKRLEELLSPICDEVNDYVRKQLYDWQNDIRAQLTPYLTDVERDLDNLISRFDQKLDQVSKILTCGNETKTGQLAGRMRTARCIFTIHIELYPDMPDFISPTEIFGNVCSTIHSGRMWHNNLMKKIGFTVSRCLRIKTRESEASIRGYVDRYFEEQSSILYEAALSLIREAEQSRGKVQETPP